MRGAWLEVDLGAIAANVRTLKAWIPPHTHLMAVVKADGYGHGAMAVAQAALEAGADWLGVATVAEGLRLRALGFTQPMLLLGLLVPDAYHTAIASDLQVVVGSEEALRKLDEVAAEIGRPAKVHLKVDTGMTRVGAALEEAEPLARMALASPHLELMGLMSHLATAEAPDPTYAQLQLERFAALEARLELPETVLRHSANSAGTLLFPQAHYSMVRPGLLIYGIPPRPDAPLPFSLTRAMSLTARITQLREVPAGVQVGYGGTFVTTRPTRLAVLPVGYADGVPRALSNRQTVLVGGVRCPIVGNVSMDQCTVDVTEVDARPGDPAVLLGEQGAERILVEEWADTAETIPYEIICGLGQRLPKVYRH
ncbi:alanine racemase [bacterium]|nr:alanine racemase [bacterium]